MNDVTLRATVGTAQLCLDATNSDGGRGRGWYLYGVIQSRGEPQEQASTLDVPSLSDLWPIQTPRQGNLMAVVSPIPWGELGSEAIQERLRDAAWLEAMIRHHSQVVAALQREYGVLPAKFGCVYGTVEALLAAVGRAHDILLAQLERFAGCDEWGVHLYADRGMVERRLMVEDQGVRRLQQDLATAGPGRAYFLQRKMADVVAATTDQALADLAQVSYDCWMGHAIAGRVGGPQNEGRAATEMEILHASFLVSRERAEDFVRQVHAYTEEREELRCEYNGPWPPYSFSSLGEEAAQ